MWLVIPFSFHVLPEMRTLEGAEQSPISQKNPGCLCDSSVSKHDKRHTKCFIYLQSSGGPAREKELQSHVVKLQRRYDKYFIMFSVFADT